MISCRGFNYAAPPRTGTTWFRHACAATGLLPLEHSRVGVHTPHDAVGYNLTTLRHPCMWLRSYYHTIYPGKIGVECVDKFAGIEANDFTDFLEGYLNQMPGAILDMFTAYGASGYLRIEDTPGAYMELVRSVDPSKWKACINVPHMNKNRKSETWNANESLWDAVLEAERTYSTEFDYWHWRPTNARDSNTLLRR